MARNLAEFLARLVEDEALRDAFGADKVATMNEYGISEEQQAAILSRDPAQIAAAVGLEYMGDQDPPLDMYWFM
jgi:hypothetical protein